MRPLVKVQLLILTTTLRNLTTAYSVITFGKQCMSPHLTTIPVLN